MFEDGFVIKQMKDMPKGVLGFLITGQVSRDDYDNVLMPPIRTAIESGDKVRALCQVGPDFDGYDKEAVWEDVKMGAEWGIGRHDSWECIAVLTDEKKFKRLATLFGWMSPGELKMFDIDQLDEAKDWAATHGG